MFYLTDDIFNIAFYFFVSKPDNRNSLLIQKFRPFPVVFSGFIPVVRVTINFNTQSYSRTIKVKNVSPVSVLLTEFEV